MAAVDDSTGASLLNSLFNFCLKLGAVVIGVIAVAGGLLYRHQNSLLYLPTVQGIPKVSRQNPRGYRSPEERGMEYENCAIVCSDGVVIHGWLLFYSDYENPNYIPPTIIFFHGNAGNIGLRLPNAYRMLQACKAHVLLVEYRGYGESDNVPPTEGGLQLDAQAALQFARQHARIDNTQLFLFGRSLGGAVAFHLAMHAQQQQLPLAGIMVENTFLSISAMVDHLMPVLKPIKPFVLNIGWDSTPLVPQLQQPILFLAGSADTLVPHQQMKELIQLATSSTYVQVHIVPGGTHNECWVQGGAAYWEAMSSFVRHALELRGGQHKPAGAAVFTQSLPASSSMQSSIPTMSTRLVDMAKDAAASSSTSKSKQI